MDNASLITFLMGEGIVRLSSRQSPTEPPRLGLD